MGEQLLAETAEDREVLQDPAVEKGRDAGGEVRRQLGEDVGLVEDLVAWPWAATSLRAHLH